MSSALPVIQEQFGSSELKSRMSRPQTDLSVPIPIANFSVLTSALPCLGSRTTQGVTSSRSNIILGEHLSGALIQLLRATYFFKAR
jgi:hypothetical protein